LRIALQAQERREADVGYTGVLIDVGFQVGERRIPETADEPGAVVEPGPVPFVLQAELYGIGLVGVVVLADRGGYGASSRIGRIRSRAIIVIGRLVCLSATAYTANGYCCIATPQGVCGCPLRYRVDSRCNRHES
jgi:hypothetical protein